MHKTKIDWCDFTYNPVWGCLNSCPYCYARSTAHRWGLSFEPHWQERNFNRAMPKLPARIFVNSMSDVMYWRPEWMSAVLHKIRANPQHTFLFLTQNPTAYQPWVFSFSDNCWLGVTVRRTSEVRVRLLLMPHWRHTFVSYEPMLEPVDPEEFYGRGLAWIILGAETGNRPGRVVPPADWIRPWLKAKIPVYMKHNLPWSGPWRKEFPA